MYFIVIEWLDDTKVLGINTLVIEIILSWEDIFEIKSRILEWNDLLKVIFCIQWALLFSLLNFPDSGMFRDFSFMNYFMLFCSYWFIKLWKFRVSTKFIKISNSFLSNTD